MTETQQVLEQAMKDYPGLDYWLSRRKGDCYIVEYKGDAKVIPTGMDARSVQAHIGMLVAGEEEE